MALLVFEDVGSSPLADLMDAAQRQKTASELNSAILASQSQVGVLWRRGVALAQAMRDVPSMRPYLLQEAEPKLPNLLKLLLWAQKQLDEKAQYPRIEDLVTASLVAPPSDASWLPLAGRSTA